MYFLCSSIPVGKISFPANHLQENICEAMKAIVYRIPRGWRNIQSVHIKSVDSISLPVYNSLPPQPHFLLAMERKPALKRVKLTEVRMYTHNTKYRGSVRMIV